MNLHSLLSTLALLVSELALLTAGDGSRVYAVIETHLTRTSVQAGAATKSFVASEEGLSAWDTVAARGVENLWLVELSALKGGTPGCPGPRQGSDK